MLNKQLDEVEVTRDLFRQALSEHTSESKNHILIQQINDWERDSIEKIQQTADEARKLLLKYTAKHILDVEIKLNKLTGQLRYSRQENDFIETDLHQWKKQLTQLTDEFNKPSNITIRQDSKALVNKIYVDISTISSCTMKINANTKWFVNGVTGAEGNERGDGLNQLDCSWSICIDDDEQVIYIADTYNHRIIEWKYGATNWQVVAGNTNGTVVAGGHGQGNRLDQLNGPGYIFVDQDYSVYISDGNNHRVMKWIKDATEGIIVAGDQGQGNGLAQLSGLRGVIVDQLGTVYVADYQNDRIMRWSKEVEDIRLPYFVPE
ncbi:unnamed protein product [Rotaria sp. Silwood1]|nr:unnamed protein product [Rotaria sp. Silwood1]